LLLVSPTQSFASIKETLLKALNVRSIKEINNESVPDDPSEIEFGVPIDRNNLKKGWEKLKIPAQDGTERKTATGRERKNLSAGPQGADLRDFQAVAFRFRKVGDAEASKTDLDIDLDDPGWNVLIPKYEDEDSE
jgi:hypothetical protein